MFLGLRTSLKDIDNDMDFSRNVLYPPCKRHLLNSRQELFPLICFHTLPIISWFYSSRYVVPMISTLMVSIRTPCLRFSPLSFNLHVSDTPLPMEDPWNPLPWGGRRLLWRPLFNPLFKGLTWVVTTEGLLFPRETTPGISSLMKPSVSSHFFLHLT